MFFVGRVTAYQHVLPKLLEIKNNYKPVVFCSINEESGQADDIDSFCKDLEIPAEQRTIEKIVFPEWLHNCRMDHSINVRGMYSMFHNQHKVLKLIDEYQHKNSVQFDCILYYRADMDSTDKLTLTPPEKNAIYLPEQEEYGGYNDRMAYGDYESMRVYCDLYSSLESLFCHDTSLTNPESILKKYLNQTGMKINMIPYNTSLHPLRNGKMAEGTLNI